MAKAENIIVEGKLDIPYNYNVGPVVTRFYDEIEDNKKIFGLKCPSCKKVYMPPRATCGACFVEMTEWVEVKPVGAVTNYTIVHYAEPALQPLTPPFAYALIKLEGADTPFVHVLSEVDLKKVAIGMKVQAVFAEEKKGNILNIKYFKPLA